MIFSNWSKAAAILSLAALTLGFIGCKKDNGGSANESVTISGAGSSFVYPVMSHWASDYQQSHATTRINYQSIGSGAGIQQVRAGTVDFGASDVPLTDAQLQGMTPVIQIPESAGPVCITYNLPELQQPLKLSGDAIVGIFLGNIKSWQDAAIAKTNPGVTLPKTSIAVVHRSDGSGTTGIFTTYLGAVSPAWKDKAGVGIAVNWPVGLGGKGSEGVTGQVRQQPGTIGYVELTYAQQNKLPVAAIQNQAGNFVAPSTAGTTAAIAAFKDELAKDVRTPIVNAPSSAGEAYPISGLTFLIIPKDGADRNKRAALKKFVQYVITDGQKTAEGLNYAPLPDAVQQQDQQTLNQLTAGGQTLP